MSAIDGDVEVGLLDVGRHAGAGTAALDINNNQRYFGHDTPTDGFGLE